MSIFKEYDIRGKYPQEINKKLALSIVKLLNYKKIILGHDGQKHSKTLTKAIIKKFKNTINLGQVPVTLVSFATYKLRRDAGIMITASHLAKNYVGFKIFNKNGLPINFKKFKKRLF